MEIADLARWTPIRFDFSGPAPMVDWADLSADRFVEPFFDETVARWATGPYARPLVRTGLDGLLALDSEPSLEPAGMIFHLSRCGSTLVSRLLGTLPGVVVLAEPSPLTALPWVGHRSRSWEPEPARWAGVQGLYALYRLADRLESPAVPGKGVRVGQALGRVGDAISGIPH